MEKIENNTNKELDLLEVGFKMLRGLYRMFGVLFIILVKRWYWFAIVAGLTLIVSAYLYRTNETQRKYVIYLMRSNAVKNGEAINLINDYFDGMKDGEVTETLRLPSAPFKIAKLSAHWGVDYNNDGVPDAVDFENNLSKDTVIQRGKLFGKSVPKQFYICLQLKMAEQHQEDSAYLSNFVSAIMRLFEHNYYVRQENEQKNTKRTVLYNELLLQIARLDSLQKLEYFGKYRTPQIAIEQSASNISLNTSKEWMQKLQMKLKKEMLDIKEELDLYSRPLTLLTDADKVSVSKQSNFFDFFTLNIFSILAGTLIFFTIWEYRRRIAASVRKELQKK